MSLTEVHQFFQRYQDAFNQCNGDAVADLWHTPSAIAHPAKGRSHAELTFWSTDVPLRANMRALCALYRDQNFARAEFEITSHIPLGNDHACVVLRWNLLRNDQSCLQTFHTAYQLMRGEEGPQVILATQYEENLAAMKSYATH